jgi:hypothetical protein
MAALLATSLWLFIIDLMMDTVCLCPMDNIGYNLNDFDPATMQRLVVRRRKKSFSKNEGAGLTRSMYIQPFVTLTHGFIFISFCSTILRNTKAELKLGE